MKHLKTMAPLLLALAMLAFLAACGSDKRESSTPSQVTRSQRCIACHSSNTSRVTGNLVVQDWLASAHSRADGGAGCDDCHQVDGHPENGVVPPLPADNVCVACHGATVGLSAAHFSTYTGVSHTRFGASYLGLPRERFNETLRTDPLQTVPGTSLSSSSCNGCHNPHNVTTLLPVNRQWAESGHGDVQDDPFNEDPFIKSTGCNRCHSATGFRWYMTHAQVPITAATLGSYSSAHEAISCNACHSNYSWRRISTDPMTAAAFVTFSTPYVRFPGVTKNFPSTSTLAANAPIAQIGDTELCIPCHSGRTGQVGAAVTATTAGPFDSHYFAAAAVMYGKIAFINFTSLTALVPGSTTAIYGNTLRTSDDVTGGVTSRHRVIGTPAVVGGTVTAGNTVLTSNGPCVVCHMTGGHTLEINATTWNNVCSTCHTEELGVPLTAANFESVFIDENREAQNNALRLAVALLETNYRISINLTDDEILENPQDVTFTDMDANNAPIGSRGAQATNWAAYLARHPELTSNPARLYKLKGAMFNTALYFKENNAFIHARTLTRRTIYDTIDFLDDGAINLSVGATALGPVGQTILLANGTPAFGKGTSAYTIAGGEPAALVPPTTSAMTYLLGFSRSTGAWSTPERP